MKRKTIKNFFRTVVAVISLMGGHYLFKIGASWIYWGANTPSITTLIVMVIYIFSGILYFFGLHMLNLAIFKIHPKRIEKKVLKCIVDFNDYLDNLTHSDKK